MVSCDTESKIHQQSQVQAVGIEQKLFQPHRRDAAVIALEHDVVAHDDDLFERIAHAQQRPLLLRALLVCGQTERRLVERQGTFDEYFLTASLQIRNSIPDLQEVS